MYDTIKKYKLMCAVHDMIYAQGIVVFICISGGRLNKKDGLTRYGDSHVKDKTS